MRVRVLLDTNILVSALLAQLGSSRAIIERLRHDGFLLVLSPELQSEYESVLARPFIAQRSGYSVEEVNAYLRGVIAKAEMIGRIDPIPIAIRDVNDNPVLATALAGDADYLVTGDEDLLTLSGDPALGSLRIVKPSEFLMSLDPDTDGAGGR